VHPRRNRHIIFDRPMKRLTRLLTALAVLACASFARAEAVRLVAPASGVTLRGGSFAELRWSAAQLPASSEEWEAFLSIDGGKYYAFRVTPHLDIALRRFTFVVPNVDTRDARILIRTGNEVHESHFESRGAFSIVRDPGAEQGLPRVLQFGRGEAARDGDPAVLVWAEGTRHGSGVTQQASPAAPASSFAGRAKRTGDVPAVLVHACDPLRAPAQAGTESPGRQRHIQKAALPSVSADLLLVCRRRNI
jgi:hypothetical protein